MNPLASGGSHALSGLHPHRHHVPPAKRSSQFGLQKRKPGSSAVCANLAEGKRRMDFLPFFGFRQGANQCRVILSLGKPLVLPVRLEKV